MGWRLLLGAWALLGGGLGPGGALGQRSGVGSCSELVGLYRQGRRLFVKDCREERLFLYWRIETLGSWWQGRRGCGEVAGGDLASVHDFASRWAVESLAWESGAAGRAGQAFVGLRRSQPNCASPFVWADGSRFDYAHWLAREPNCLAGLEFCVAVSQRAEASVPQGPVPQGPAPPAPLVAGWNDVFCQLPLKAICRLPLFSPAGPPSRLQRLQLLPNATTDDAASARLLSPQPLKPPPDKPAMVPPKLFL